jgi:hypothetical protein
MKMMFKSDRERLPGARLARNPNRKPSMSSRLASVSLVVSGAATLALAGATAGAAHADRRAFTETYEYTTTPEGQTEVEIHTAQSRLTFDGATSPQEFQLELEIEHGITDRWDIALYHVFTQATDGMGGVATPFGLHKLKLESRYRFAERGELPVDVLVYGELAKDFGASVYEVEAKAILARDFGRVTVAANLIGEVEVGNDVPEAEVELGFAAGLTYEVSPRWKIGAETWGGFEAEEPEELGASAGPAISWAPGSRIWLSATAGFGLTDEAAAFTGQAIIGLNL